MSMTAAAPHVTPISLIRGAYLTTDLSRARLFFEELMGMECVAHGQDAMLVRNADAGSAESYWTIEVRQVAEIANPQEVLNHWGFTVATQAEVDQAYEVLKTQGETYGVPRVLKPRSQHNAYSFYFADVDSNWWEIEYREPDYVYAAVRARGDQA